MRTLLTPLLALFFLAVSAFQHQDATSFYMSGLEHFKQNNYLEAIADLTHALSLKKDYADAYYLRAQAKWMLGKKMGFNNTEFFYDLITAHELGKTEATTMLLNVYNMECFTPRIAFNAPDKVFCADFSYSSLSEIPERLPELKYMVSLHLQGNQLKSLQGRLSPQFSHLMVLDLSSNQLSSLDAEISTLRSLYELNLNENKLTALPANLGKLYHLKALYARNNQLKTLPASLSEMRSLEVLDISLNQISSLPLELLQLGQLKKLYLTGNPLTAEEVEKLRENMPSTEIFF